LGGILASMGMPDAMDNKTADFSGMDGRRDLYIGEVIQKALIAVDEDGTEAAASTVVILPGAGANEPDLEVHLTIDRPFIFVIHDWRTHSILFIGQVVDPR
jgi:serpin B